MLDTSPSPRTGIPREPSGKVPVAAVAEPMPAPAAAPRSGSRAPVIAILVLIAMAAGAAAVWFFVLRKPGKTDADTNGTQVASNRPSGSATPHPGSQVVASGAGTASGTGTGSAAGTGSQLVASGASIEPVTLVAVTINSNADGAQVEVVGTDAKGPAPFEAKLEKGKKATVRVSAPGFAAQDLEVTGGDKPVTVKLKPMDRMVHVESTPSGAAVFVNNGPTGKTTPADIKLASSLLGRPNVKITVRKSGYNKGETTVALADYAEKDGRLVADVSQALTVARPIHTTGGGAGTTGGSGATGSGTTGTGDGSATTSTGGSGTTTSGSGSTGGTTGTGDGSSKPPDAGSGATKPPETGSGKSTGSGAGSAKSGSGEPVPDWMK
jgi:hypothetical protein